MGENNIKPCKEVCNVPDEILKQLQEDVGEIKAALLGNKYNDAGLIKKHAEVEENYKRLKEHHDKDITIINSKLDKINWTAGGISAGVSFIIGIVLFVLKITGKL